MTATPGQPRSGREAGSGPRPGTLDAEASTDVPGEHHAGDRHARGPWADAMGRAGARAGQTLLIAAIVVGAVWLLLRVSVVVIAILVALILAAAVAPLVRWLESKGWSRLWATLASFVGILLLVGGVITGVVFAIRSEWDSLVSSATDGWQEFRQWLDDGPLPVDTGIFDDAASQITESLSSGSLAGGVLSGTLSGLSAATQFVTGVVLMIIVLFFLLKDGPLIVNFALRWFRGETRAKLAESIDRSSDVLGGYVRGTAIIAAVDAVLIGIGLLIVGIPLALPLAVIVFLGGFIPIVGATVAGILAALVALVTAGPVEALIVVGIVVVVNQVEGDLLQPVVMGRTLSLHALIVLLALTIGTIVGGIFGAVLAVPYTAVAWSVIQIWTDRYQAGDDPVLGKDPVGAEGKVAAKATGAQRGRYQRMRLLHRQGGNLGATTEQAERQGVASDGAADGEHEVEHSAEQTGSARSSTASSSAAVESTPEGPTPEVSSPRGSAARGSTAKEPSGDDPGSPGS